MGQCATTGYMWTFPSKKAPESPVKPVDDAQGRVQIEQAERIALLEADLTGLKLQLGHLTESTERALGKLAARARRDVVPDPPVDEDVDLDPRIKRLLTIRGGRS